MTGPEGACSYVNASWAGLLGCSTDELLGTGWIDSIAGADGGNFAAEWDRSIERGEPFSSFRRFRTPDGHVWMSIHAEPVREGGELIGYSGCAHEVPRQILDRHNLAARSLAHDLHNMLTVIKGHWEMKGSSGRHPTGAAGAVDVALERALEIVGELLGSPTSRVPRDLNGLLGQVEAIVAPILAEGVTLRLETDPSIGEVSINASLLWRALLNVVLNASEAMVDGGELVVSTSALVDDGHAWARITVSDTGRGFDRDSLEGPFVPGSTKKADGRIGGIGLAIADACVRFHEGRIDVRSELGEGTTVHIDLPV